MRSSVSEPLIPLNAANLRIIPHVHKYFTPFLQKPCKLIHYQTRSCRVRAIKCESANRNAGCLCRRADKLTAATQGKRYCGVAKDLQPRTHKCSGFALIVLQSAIYTKRRGDSTSTTLQKRLSDHAKRALIHHLM